MADENNNVPDTSVIDAGGVAKAATPKKQKTPRRAKQAAEPAPAKTAAVPARQRKNYSDSEKRQKLDLIETQVAQGKATQKEAIKNAGISVQTYYLWKRTEKPAATKVKKPVSNGADLADLVQLEAENKRLRGLLAEKLRTENVELRNRLGLD